MSEESYCIVGKAPCGCYCFAASFIQIQSDDLREMADMLDEGWKLELKPVKWVHEGNLTFHVEGCKK